jgi:hypothetical protein
MLLKKTSTAVAAWLLCLFLTFSVTGSAAEPRVRRAWKYSLALLAAADAADVQSNWRRPEANPALRGANGRFSMQGVGIKAGLSLGSALAQWRAVKKNPKVERYCAWFNLATAGVIGVQAARNYRER